MSGVFLAYPLVVRGRGLKGDTMIGGGDGEEEEEEG